MLRIVGASRRQVFRSVLLEAGVLGLVASLVGLGLGVLAALGLEALLKGFGITLPSGSLVFVPRTVIAALVIGIGVTVVSAISPARRAVRIPPVAALADYRSDQEESSRRRIVVGSILAVLGIVALTSGLTKPAIQLVGIGAVAIFIGIGMLAPIVARPMSSAIGRPLARLLGISGKLGRENSMRSPRRTAQTASALMVGLALVSTIAVFGASLSKSATDSVDNAINADYIITSSSQGGSGGFSNSVATAAARGAGGHRGLDRLQWGVRVPTVAVERDGDLHQPAAGNRQAAHGIRIRCSCPRRRPTAHRHQHGQLQTPWCGLEGSGHVRPDREARRCESGGVQAERAARGLPRGRRLFPLPFRESVADRSPPADGRFKRQHRIRRVQRAHGLSGPQDPDPGAVREGPAEPGQPIARDWSTRSWH